MKNERLILAQGSRDGACFLYSLANAVQALTEMNFNEKTWGAAVRSLPFDMGDFLAGRGTEKLDDEPDLLISLARIFIKTSGSAIELKWMHGVSDILTIKKQLSKESLLVIEVDDGAHWVTVVDTADGLILSACSAMALSSTEPYSELTSGVYGRRFNRQDSIAELKINHERVLKIALVS